MVLITKEFISQTTPLTIEDFSIFFKCIIEYNSLGFFNGGFHSGASQPRKHMQLVPLSSISITSTLSRIPLDTLIHQVLESQPIPYSINTEQILTIPQFKFPHGLIMLGGDILRMSPMDAGKYLSSLYSKLLQHCSMTRLYETVQTYNSITNPSKPSKEILTLEQDYTSHNVLLTKEYIFVVPRKKESYMNDISVNALGYAGYFLARSDSTTVQTLQSKGPLEILKACATGEI